MQLELCVYKVITIHGQLLSDVASPEHDLDWGEDAGGLGWSGPPWANVPTVTREKESESIVLCLGQFSNTVGRVTPNFEFLYVNEIAKS